MPQLIFFAALGIVAYVGYRSFIREAERLTAKARRAEAERRTGTQGTLVKDPKTGEYHLLKD
jgi:membrane protein implicated in regulation of membrane protease activity